MTSRQTSGWGGAAKSGGGIPRGRAADTYPDYLTAARAEAKLQWKEAMVNRQREQEARKVDYRTHSRQVMEDTRKQVEEILNDPYRGHNPRQQHEEAMTVAREGQTAHRDAVQEASAAYDAEVERLERLANPPRQRGQRSTAELLERQEVLKMNERRWERGGGEVVLAEYRQALAQGDQMMAELLEDFAGEHIKDSAKRNEFSDLVYEQQRSRLPAPAKNALTQLEALVQEETKLKMGMEHQRGSMADFVDGVRQSRPIRTRDDVAGEKAAGLAQVGSKR